MVWRGGHAPHIVHWWHPNSPKPELCTSHQPIPPPRILQAKTNPTTCSSRQMGSTRKPIGGRFANRNNKITETGTQSLRPPTIAKQETSKATTELLFQKSQTNLQVGLVSPPKP
jgi:hypothetical protein